MAYKAFLNIGISFAELKLQTDAKSGTKSEANSFFKRIYLAQESLNIGLKKAWQEIGETPSSIVISSRYLEKILDAKLGGSVAQIVTKGFETWPILRQPLNPGHFTVTPKRQEPLASKDLVFGITERVCASSEKLIAVDISELEFINSKLKLMSVKRVCINLLHSQISSNHQKQVAHYFKEQGFEVFAADRLASSRDEMPAWRKNVINACLSGAFSELVEEIKKSLVDTVCEISFLDSAGDEFLSDKNFISNSLFAWTNLLKKRYADTFDQVLFLGLEGWYLISTKKMSKFWESPWGLIELDSPEMKKLSIQPTQEITSTSWGGLGPGASELGYEPGPISFGRAHRATVFDFMVPAKKITFNYITPTGLQRFNDQLFASIKSLSELRSLNSEKLVTTVYDHCLQNLALDCHFASADINTNTVITGFFAPYLYADLKANWHNSKLSLDANADEAGVRAIMHLKGVNL